MHKLLIPLLAALALPTAVNAEIDNKTAEFCLKASDFAGCVETMSRGLDSKREKDVDDGLRTWTRDTGVVVRMRTNTLIAIPNKGSYGRYLQWYYARSGDSKVQGKSWEVTGDCEDFSANWEGDGLKWMPVQNPEEFLTRRFPFPHDRWGQRMNDFYPSAVEAKDVLDEFCPQMDRLVLEAKERDRVNGIEEAKNKSSSVGMKVNCNSPVWRDKPRCN
tara:strand:- start:423 stop:1076 length:654 start_codon:yes stop_codon:yes gene_type:complete